MAKSKWKKQASDKPRIDPLEKVADRFIAALEEGKRPWRQVYQRGPHNPAFFNNVSKKPYKGVNQLLLAISPASDSGDPRWMTFKQIKDKGWSVKKGESGTPIVFFKEVAFKSKPDENAPETQDKFKLDDSNKGNDLDVKEADDNQAKKVMVAREYYVWNGSQIEGIEPWVQPEAEQLSEYNPNETAQAVIEESGARIVHGNPVYPLYSPSRDQIEIYPATQFESTTHYYAVLSHELTHWTGHESRTGRLKVADYMNDKEARAKEELVAEIGSYMLMGALGIQHDGDHPDSQHIAYVQSWIEIIQNDKRRAIWRAVKQANQAMGHIASLSPTLQAILEADSAELEDQDAEAEQNEGIQPAPVQETEQSKDATPEATEEAQEQQKAQEPMAVAEDMGKYILIAADSVAQLRSIDVYRVINSNPTDVRVPLARYIAEQRPDLLDELDDVMRNEFDLVEWNQAGDATASDSMAEKADVSKPAKPEEEHPKPKRPAFIDAPQREDFDAVDGVKPVEAEPPVAVILTVSGVNMPSGEWLTMGYETVKQYGLAESITEHSLMTPEVNFPDGRHWSGTVMISPEDRARVTDALKANGISLKTEGVVNGGEQQMAIIRSLPSFDAAYLDRVVEVGARFRLWGSERNANNGVVVTVTDVQPDKVRLVKDGGGGHALDTFSLLQYVQPVEVPADLEPELTPAQPNLAAGKSSGPVFDFG